MKIRTGFVSNSSSSSFVVVGTADDHKILEMAKAEGKQEFDCSLGIDDEDNTFVYVGSCCDSVADAEHNMINSKWGGGLDITCAGIYAEDLIKQDKTLSEIKDIVIEKAKKIGVLLYKDELDLYYGESSSE